MRALLEVRQVVSTACRLIDDAQRATRSLAAQLSPPVLDRLGLVPALEWLAEEIGASFGLAITVDDDGMPKPLSQQARTIVYRAVRELLINVARHAKVDHAHVEVVSVHGTMTVRVSDAGVGFQPETLQTAHPARGLGLLSVRERLSYIGGRFELRAAPGEGTEAVLTLPLAPAPPDTAW
ncbi:sensor histidine kinase [Ideonella sp. YS5]|uniref:sensor histidine kinase n=1 Tax=Ideonella sp. YS5 TaxID=3453714 RepID=UPI003EEC85A5